MTSKQFNKYAKQGKTVLSMDFVEGREGMCTTGVVGNPAIYLDQIAKKLGFIMLQLQSGSKENIDVVKVIDTLADNTKVYYGKFAMNLAKGVQGDSAK